jgi:hypothetical protein
MESIEGIAALIHFILFFVSMVDRYLFAPVAILFVAAASISNQYVTIICAAIAIYFVGSYFSFIFNKH